MLRVATVVLLLLLLVGTVAQGAIFGPRISPRVADLLEPSTAALPFDWGFFVVWNPEDGVRCVFVEDSGATVTELLPPPGTAFYEAVANHDGEVAAVCVEPFGLVGGIWTWDPVTDEWTQETGSGINLQSLTWADGRVGARDYNAYFLIPVGAAIHALGGSVYEAVDGPLMDAGIYGSGMIPITEQLASDWHFQRLRVIDTAGAVIYDLPWVAGAMFQSMSFSPDGSKLLYRAVDFSGFGTLKVCDPSVGYGKTVARNIATGAWLPQPFGGIAWSRRIDNSDGSVTGVVRFEPKGQRFTTRRVAAGSIIHMDLF